MPDTPLGTEQTTLNSQSSPSYDCDAVCIDAARIYDSCGAKDCLDNLPLLLTESEQEKLENACSVRINKASVITSTLDVEPVAFHKGFYSVDMVFYFSVCCDVYYSSSAIPETVNGLAVYGKRVVLYGSGGNVKSFSSDSPVVCAKTDCDCACSSDSMPKATVQISDPMALSAKLNKGRPKVASICGVIPECVKDSFCGDFCKNPNGYISVTIGIFTITQLQRNVQIMIPSYDFCVPRKECAARTDDPCEVFSKIEFPTDSFFPPRGCDSDKGGKPFECNCK